MRPIPMRAAPALAAAAFALAACATPPDTAPRTSAYDTSIQSEMDQQLASSAARAANSLETLAMIERTRTVPTAPAVDISQLPPELKVPATLEWSGPAADLVRELAKKAGYSFFISGAPSPAPLMAHVSLHDIALGQAFANVGVQVDPFATVILNPNARTVEFRFESGGTRTTGLDAQISGSDAPSRPAAHHAYGRHAVRKKTPPAVICVPATVTAVPVAPAPPAQFKAPGGSLPSAAPQN
jgi:defect-in-organelle-trafficking protein DotD